MGGTTLGAEAEVGCRFDLGRVGLELSTKTQRYQNLVNDFGSTKQVSTSNSNINHTVKNEEGQTVAINYLSGDDFSSSWKYGMQQTGIKAQLNFGSKKTQFGAGLEAGTRNSIRPNISYNSEKLLTVDIKMGDEIIDTQQLAQVSAIKVDNSSKGFVDGTLKAKRELGKGFSLQAEANVPIIDKSKAAKVMLGVTYKIK